MVYVVGDTLKKPNYSLRQQLVERKVRRIKTSKIPCIKKLTSLLAILKYIK